MAKLNLSHAAKAVGKNRVTLWRHINTGKLSAERDRDGNPLIDTSELLRVYGELKGTATHGNIKKQHHETPSHDELLKLVKELKAEQQEMKTIIIDLRNRLEYNPKSSEYVQRSSPYENENVTKSKPEENPQWPQTISSVEDLIKRQEIRNKLK